jgi:polysaccharide deacetylase family protein (PEP-CTERM system associated)
MMKDMLHAFSVDVEDWYQSSHDFNAPISEVCVRNSHRVLKFLAHRQVRGTFFVQGLVAKYFPGLVKDISGDGHEIQSHGYSHRPVCGMTPDTFKEELKETSARLSDIIGKPITGFRAPDFSINERTFWAFEIMHECGIRYDSSIFPMKTSRYGIDGFERGYSLIKTNNGAIEELPVTVLELSWPGGRRLPVGGGGYFRLFPTRFLRYCVMRLEKENMPFVIYCHPYEFNPDEWSSMKKYIPLRRRMHQGIGRAGFKGKIDELLGLSRFGSISEVLEKSRGRMCE